MATVEEDVAGTGVTRPSAVCATTDRRTGNGSSTRGTSYWEDMNGGASCAGFRPAGTRTRSGRWLLLRLGIPLATLVGLSVVFVGSEVLERKVFPALGTGWRHGLLTVLATVTTAAASAAVYLVMRRQQVRLSKTAEQLTRVLESYRTNHSAPGRFVNPHVVRWWESQGADEAERGAVGCEEDRCWQLQSLRNGHRAGGMPALTIQQCHDCEVYQRSCPDKLTELGESFNNLMFLLEQEARQVNHMRGQMVEKEKMVAIGQMASGIAHEVGNPLSSISAIVQMLKRDKGLSAKSDQLDLIQTHIRRISAIVRQLVSLARPSVERWEPVDVGELLEEAVRLISFDRRAKKVDISLAPIGVLPKTHGLRGELQQVMINLLLNALDAMPEGGWLSISARAVRGGIEIAISDSGCGIPEETGRRVFEPFFTTKEVGHGTGLGLSVSYGIVQKHGGTIDFGPVEGGGTVFTVYLPIQNRPPEENHGPANRTARG